MSDIHYLYGSRIQTPSTANNNQVQLGDTNNDGVIDILDAGDVTSGLIWDANNDGTIDILDAAEILANGGIPNNPVSPPNTSYTNLSDDELLALPGPTISDPVICSDNSSTEPRFTFNTNGSPGGIITTGCNSIYNVDGTIDWPEGIFDEDNPFFCPEGKMRGFSYDGTGGVSYQDQCTCIEAGVGAAEIAMLGFFGGPGKDGAKDAAKKVLKRTIATAEDSLEKAMKYKNFLQRTIDALFAEGKKLVDQLIKTDELLKDIDNRLEKGISRTTGLPYTPEQIAKFERYYEKALSERMDLDMALKQHKSTIERMQEEMKRFDDIIAAAKKTMENMKPLIDGLDHFDPEKWVSIIFGTLVPISQFFVPKECASNQELDDECNCVDKPIVSGSYSPSNLNLQIPNNYNIVESL
jgi:hypothetical protein